MQAVISQVVHYDVGNITQGSVRTEVLSDHEKTKYLSCHFIPAKNFSSFVTQTIVRGKMKQKKVLVFQHSWLEKYGWLVYSPAAGSGLCKYCTLFASKNDKRKYVGVLVSKPFVNLVKAAGKDGVLENHQNHQYHKDAVQRGLLLVQHQKTPGSSMSYLISQANRQVYQKNIHILKSIVEAVVLCGKQSLPIRGHRDDRSSISSNKGNFLAIIDLMAKHDSTLGSKTHNTHRKPFRIRSKQNTRSLDDENAFFSIMADEVTDPHGRRGYRRENRSE